MTTQQETAATEGHNTADDSLVKAIARVAHETVAAHNTAYGDYSTPPWERLPESERAHVLAKVTAFLNNPDLHPTAQHGPAEAEEHFMGMPLNRGEWSLRGRQGAAEHQCPGHWQQHAGQAGQGEKRAEADEPERMNS